MFDQSPPDPRGLAVRSPPPEPPDELPDEPIPPPADEPPPIRSLAGGEYPPERPAEPSEGARV